MAAELLGGAAIGAVFGELLKAVLEVMDKASNFKNTLAYLRNILVKIDPLIKEMEQQNGELGRSKEELGWLIEEMKEGRKLVYKCCKIHRLNFLGRIQNQDELAKLAVSLEGFFRFDVPAQTSRDTKETLFKVTRILSADTKIPLVGTQSENASASDSDFDSLPLELQHIDEIESLAMPVLEDIATLVHKSSQAEAKVHKGYQNLHNKHEASGRLRSSIQFFGSKMGFIVSDEINLIAEDISKLEDEFKLILSFFSKPVESKHLFDCLTNSMRPSSGSTGHEGDPSGEAPSSSSHHSESTPLNLIPSRIVDVRSNWLEESIQRFGVEKLNNDDAQKLQWELLEAKIGSWIHLMPIAAKLFASEREVCNLIFEGFDSLAEHCFAEVTTNSIYMLLSVGEANARILSSPRSFHLLLDMYETMLELHLEIKTLFRGKSCTEIREAAIGFTKQLALMSKEVFGDLEEVVDKDAIETAVTDGIHPLTSNILNFVRVLYDYESTLKQLFQEFEGGDYSSQQASVTKRAIQALKSKLKLKSEQYRDPVFKHIFLMNNIYHIVQFDLFSSQFKCILCWFHVLILSCFSSEAKDILGDDWVLDHSAIVQRHSNEYIRNAWAKTLKCISAEGIYKESGVFFMNSGVSRAILKDSLKTFNDMFEELHWKQCEWSVPDWELRESLQVAVIIMVLPAYKSFRERFSPLVESGKSIEKYIKYTTEDLKRMLGEFFQGNNISHTTR
ncbi:hypothetical protein PIB30_045451 [Stylosanthes scabra]|uniref:Exocyst subunit Exo70 family protein n=1 Tax=Stylosanthes scabra TaxID=79078 RepID=A0ABU6SG10_9FABA|nr:hypothetical protein [Stylosanthes scabra]